jgi:L-seryl-tRNA(Ser) seleniumtransferase
MSRDTKSIPSRGSGLSRRQFFGSTAFSGLFGAFGGAAPATPAPLKRDYDNSIYTRLLGVRPHLPGHEHTTFVGGSRMPEEVLRAMQEANEYFVDMNELVAAAGRRIAEVTHAEAGLVTAGSFSSLILGAAACLTGTDLEKITALPHPTWERREVLMQTGHRFGYDRAYRAAGMEIVEVETREEFANAITPKTAMISVLANVERLDPMPEGMMTPLELLTIGKKAGVPVFVDAASELPPTVNLTKYTEMGADLVAISGGKGIQGPQSSGILAGRRDLIEAATLNAFPNSHLGRGMKVGKEEIVGMITALNRYVELDHEAILESWNRKSQYLVEQLAGIPGLTASMKYSKKGYADVELTWDEKVIPITVKEAQDKLRTGTPRIYWFDPVFMTRCLEDGEEILVARRLRRFFLEEARAGG